MRYGKLALGAMASAAALLSATPALAHAKLVKSDPAANASVAAPTTITLTFSEELAPAFSTAELVMVGHNMNMKIPVKVTFANGGKTLLATPQGHVTPGSYQIKWAAASADDGHRMNGEVPFQVR